MFSLDLIICTYNNANLLERTLASVVSQQVPPGMDWRILVVNNNCTDRTTQVVEHFADISPVPLRMVMETTQGLTPARARGVRETASAWIAFIDDDALLDPGWIAQAASFADSHPGCGGFGSRITLHWESAPPAYVRRFPYAYAGRNHGDSPKRMPAVAGLGMVLRRATLEATGWTECQLLPDRTGNRLVSGGDVEISMRIAARSELWYNPHCRITHLIPAHRFTRPYLERMFFGLAVSRHHAGALRWSGPYFTWLVFSFFYSFGVLGLSLRQLIPEIPGPRDAAAGPGPAFSHYRGWWAAIFQMLRMNPSKRRMILGAAKKRGG